MSFNGSGTFLINTAGQPVVSGTVISSTAFNSLTADLATGLSTAITKDGQTTVTANIPMSTYKFTGLGVGSAATDSANLSQVQSTVTKLLNSVSGADTITATASPTLAAYAAGQMFYFVAAGDNTTSVTLNIDALGAKAVTRDGSVALAAADIKSGEVIVVVYDGTRFQVVSQLNSAGNATFANVSITSALNVGGVATFSAGTAAAPSITTTGDTNTGIFFPAADTIAFTEGGTESLRVNSSGNMGLGTTSPTNTAGFSRQLQIEGTTAALTLSGTTGTGKYTLGVPGANAVGLWDNTASAYRWYVDSSGNLGIGTSSPGSKLHVLGSAQVSVTSGYNELGLNGTYASASARVGAFRKNYDSPFDFNIYASVGSSGNAGAMIFWRDSANENARFDTSGNLGISQGNAPTQVLSLYRSGSTNALMSAGNSNTGLNGTLFGVDTAGNGIVTQTQALPLIFSTSNTERARITAAGDMGVGTASPSSRFHAQGGAAAEITTTQNTNASTPYGHFVYFSAAAPNNATQWFIKCQDSAAERATIRSNGGLANYSANDVNLASDERLKKDISPLNTAWDKVKNIEVVNYRYKDCNEGDPLLYGVIAQQVQPIVPELVVVTREATETDPEYYGIREQPMYWLAIKALQEAMTKIEKLEAEVAALKGA